MSDTPGKEPPRTKGGMGGHAARGAAITGVAQIVKLGVQIASVTLLSRLLSPADFGLVAMCTPVIAFLAMLQNLGLSQAVVVARTITPEQNSALFWTNVGLAVGMTAALALLSPLIAAFYRAPALQPLLIALSASILLSGLSAQHGALLNRGMRFKQLAIIDMTSAVVSLLAALAWAYVYPGPWALVAFSLTNAAVVMVGAWSCSNWRPGRLAPFADIKGMLKFGGGLSTFNLSNFVARSLDNILIGRFIGPAPLGLYDRAYKLLLFPLQQISYPLGRVMVPLLSRLVDQPERYRSAYARTVAQILLVTTPGTLSLLFLADVVIPLLLGPQWVAAVDIFRWLALAALHQSMTVTIGWLFISQSRTGEFAYWGIFNAISCAIAFSVGLIWGVEGVAACYALSDVFIRLPAVWYVIGRRGPVSTKDLIRIAAPFVLAGGASALALVVLRLLLNLPPAELLAAGVAISYSSFGLALLLSTQGRTVIAETFTMTRMVLRRA